jgi:hypothetical protein
MDPILREGLIEGIAARIDRYFVIPNHVQGITRPMLLRLAGLLLSFVEANFELKPIIK